MSVKLKNIYFMSEDTFENTTVTDDALYAVEGSGEYLNKNGDTLTGILYASDGSQFPVVNTAGAHNCVYRGKNLTNEYTLDEISEKIQANDWSDLYIGDYIEKTMTSSYGTETVRWLFAGFDIYLNRGDTALLKHHIAMIPEDCFATTSYMNSTNITTDSFHGSYMNTTVLPAYASALKDSSCFGSHVTTFRNLEADGVSTSAASAAGAGWTGASNSWAWYDTSLTLLSEVQAYGANCFSSSGYDTGIKNQQLPLFRLCPDKLVAGGGFSSSGRCSWWLASVASSTYFCFVGDGGVANARVASALYGVRPLFLFT